MAAATTALPHPHLYRMKMKSSHPSFTSPIANYPNRINCSDSSRGFGPKSKNADSKKIKSPPKQSSTTLPNQAPGLSSPNGGKIKYTSTGDLEFEQRLQAVRKSALEQKKVEKENQYGVIDYDAPTESNNSTIGLGTKIGVGVAVAVFGLVFALGDFLPTGSVSPTEEAAKVNKISAEERTYLEKRLTGFEETLGISPEDSTALEGAAVTLTEMREYKRASPLLEKLAEASETIDFEILRGLTNALLAGGKPDEAVQVLLASRERLSREKNVGNNDGSTVETRSNVDPVQVELLLGKAYSDWGHISDAVSVYDQLISSHPDDFRGYLAKARFFAPDKAKLLVDKYSR
ncbi:hypothetical protein ACJIZ3_021029 [Penstemon smallii]|uniref:Uncharacterized protein n=1 Tax=Penstemon smallii TaxID=265156 RepID=A0ABD3SKH9_9LAMI